jgi:hypothetical protein
LTKRVFGRYTPGGDQNDLRKEFSMARLTLADPVTSIFSPDVKVPKGPSPAAVEEEEQAAAAEARRKERQRAASATGTQRSLLGGTGGASNGARKTLLGSSQ